MSGLPFLKGHGLGNDFVVVSESDLSSPLTPEQVRRICDRRLGVGADGVLVFRGGDTPYMQILNSDGSEPEMCGNGLRVFARYLVEAQGFSNQGTVATLAGPRTFRILDDQSVEVGMGQAEFVSEADGLVVELPDWAPLRGSHVSMGNPHFVVFEDDAVLAPHELARLGAKIQDHQAFPDGVNLSSAAMTGASNIDLRVFERGCGLTEACGTAACAVAAAAVHSGRVPQGEAVAVRLPGGPLMIQVAADGSVRMTGTADIVARGLIDRGFLG
jgi:diaminopimelate epimerase